MRTEKYLPILIPVVMMLCIIASVSFLSYGLPQGPWVTVVYPNKNTNAFVQSLPFVKAIAANKSNIATVYVKNTDKITQLKSTGAYIIDPTGVPLCLRP